MATCSSSCAMATLTRGIISPPCQTTSTATSLRHHRRAGQNPAHFQGQSTQFFFGYQYTMYHQASNASQTTVPTLAEEGNAPASPMPILAICAPPVSMETASVQTRPNGSPIHSPTRRIRSTDTFQRLRSGFRGLRKGFCHVHRPGGSREDRRPDQLHAAHGEHLPRVHRPRGSPIRLYRSPLKPLLPGLVHPAGRLRPGFALQLQVILQYPVPQRADWRGHTSSRLTC